MLYSFHYLVTPFFVAVWTNSLSWTLLLYYVFQMSYLLAGGAVPDPTLYWGWQSLVAALGTAAGLAVRHTRKGLLDDAYSWFYFIASLAASLGAQLLYAYFPPFPGVPAGQAAVGLTCTLIISLLIILAVWYGMSREHRHLYYYGRWAFFTFLMQALFFLALTGWAEHWLAISVGGGVLLLQVLSARRGKYDQPRPRSMARRPHV